MAEEKLISIIVPTSNRGKILEQLLPLLFEQIKRHREEVELIVCDNASSDDTVAILEKIQLSNESCFSLVKYDAREDDVGAAIARAGENGTGKYIQFWSDDDLPCPFMIDIWIDVLRRHPDVGCVMANRLISSQNDFFPLLPVGNLRCADKSFVFYEKEYAESEDFIESTANTTGFLGNYLVLRAAWKKGMSFYNAECLGYQFFTPLFAGLKGMHCVYFSYPILIQRQFDNPRYIDYWPLYLYIGLSRVYKILEQANVISDWRKPYYKYRFCKEPTSAHVWQLLYRCASRPDIYLPHKSEIVGIQPTRIRRCAAMLIGRSMFEVRVGRILYWFLYGSIISRACRKVLQKLRDRMCA